MRGNSSYEYSKKSYRLEVQDEDGRDRDLGLLGLAADSDWVLYAAVTDRTFVRNALAHELWRALGRYAVRWRFVEVFVLTNAPVLLIDHEQIAPRLPAVLRRLGSETPPTGETGRDDSVVEALRSGYMGLYVLLEKIKRGEGRMEIARLRSRDDREPAITGGYIIKKDDVKRGERGVLTGQEFSLRFEEPKERELTPVQRRWMEGYLEQFEKALFGRHFRDPDAGYAAYIDVDSFIDFHWLVEVAKNADGYWFSQYMHKDRGGKLTMGPLWDWDRTFGTPFFGSVSTNGWRFETAADPDYTWYRRLFDDPDFLQRYVDRWMELRSGVLATSNVLALVDRLSAGLGPAFRRNSVRWERDPEAPGRALAGVGHDAELAEMKRWIRDRLAWIDAQDYPRPVLQLGRPKDGVTHVSMACLDGRLYYTLDGTDPRARGGAPSATAIEYRDAIETSNQVVTARVRSQFGLWSAPVTARTGEGE